MKHLTWSIILLNIVTAALSQYKFWNSYWFANDFQFALACASPYFICPMSKWRLKLILFVSMYASIAILIHNFLVQQEVVAEGWPALISFLVVAIGSIIIYMPFLNYYEKLPNHTIEDGSYYEIIGKPRTNLQFLLSIFTGAGSYAATDGVDCIYMSKELKKSVREPLDRNYLNGKKCILLGPKNPRNKELFNSKENIKFRLIRRNCYWLGKGFKNV